MKIAIATGCTRLRKFTYTKFELYLEAKPGIKKWKKGQNISTHTYKKRFPKSIQQVERIWGESADSFDFQHFFGNAAV